MNILLIGSGGREHAIAWKLRQSPICKELYIAPGNAGTKDIGTNLEIAINDFEAITNACRKHSINMVIVGPEEPLVKGISDHLKKELGTSLLVIGPSQNAAQLEGSKAFAKEFMGRHKIPTAKYREFTEENFTEGIEYLKQHKLPIVLKADGLAAGKGVIICQHHVEAVSEFELMIQRSKFGEAGKKVVVEEFLTGIELSVFVLTDGKNFLILPEAKDYKRVGEGDTGLNTGGMGAISPVPFADAAFMQKVKEKVVQPSVNGLASEGLEYRGFLFCGLIRVGDDPYVIEYNCRMGDPETQVVLPRIQSDLVELLKACASGTLNQQSIEVDERFAATTVAVSGGYPNDYQKGYPINLPALPQTSQRMLFHMGTKEEGENVVTNGGRVVCATALSDILEDAIHSSQDMIEEVKFEARYYRKDIGFEFL